MKKLRFLLSVSVLLYGLSAYAAQVPKPSIRFYIRYADESQKQAVRMILQHESDTSGAPKEVGQNNHGHYFDTTDVCRNSVYCEFSSRLRKYHQLILVYDDHSEISEDIEPDAYHSAYDVSVSAGKITLTNTTPWFLRTGKPYSMYRTVLLAFVTELLVLWLVLLVVRYPDKGRFLLGMLLANVVGLPLFFGLMALSDTGWMWFVAEALMIAVETLIVWVFMKKAVSPGKTAFLVFLLNLFSVFAGGAALFFAMLFGQDLIQYLR